MQLYSISECWGQAKHEGVICGLFICLGRLALEEQCTFCIRSRKNLTAYASLDSFPSKALSTAVWKLHSCGIHKMEQIWIELGRHTKTLTKHKKIAIIVSGMWINGISIFNRELIWIVFKSNIFSNRINGASLIRFISFENIKVKGKDVKMIIYNLFKFSFNKKLILFHTFDTW